MLHTNKQTNKQHRQKYNLLAGGNKRMNSGQKETCNKSQMRQLCMERMGCYFTEMMNNIHQITDSEALTTYRYKIHLKQDIIK